MRVGRCGHGGDVRRRGKGFTDLLHRGRTRRHGRGSRAVLPFRLRVCVGV